VGCDPASVNLVVVTKKMSIHIVQVAIECGLQCFSNKYAEEDAEKIKTLYDHNDLEGYMIGHLQRRKAGLICAILWFATILR